MAEVNPIVEKIQRLLALAGDTGATPAEIENAMGRATRLMAEYHLTEEDLAHEPEDDFARVDQAEMGDSRVVVGRRIFHWEHVLANFVAEFVGVPVCRDNRIATAPPRFGQPKREGKSVVFYGIAEDAAIGARLFDELRTIVSTLAFGIYGNIYRGDGSSYCLGFVHGLWDRMSTQRAKEKTQATSTALAVIDRRHELVVFKKLKARSWLASKGVEIKEKFSRSATDAECEAAIRGRQDGQNYEVSAKRAPKLTAGG